MSVTIDPLAGLNEAQKVSVEQTDGPVLVLAGAGSGKTRVLAHRIAYIVKKRLAKPWQILAVTFTNKAARELRERVSSITEGGDEVAAGTFHSTMLRVLRRESKALGYPGEFTIFDNDDSVRLVKLILKDWSQDEYSPKAIFSSISNLKNDMVSPEDYEKGARTPIEKLTAKVYKRYQEKMKHLAAMDFDDLLLKPIELFKKHPAVLNKWSNRWRYIHVDEYQDTNLAQFELVKLLGGPKPNLCVVGDDDQSIYGWRGARVENIFRFKETFDGAKVFRLEQNYRSTQAILDLAHSVVSLSSKREEKKLWTEKKEGKLPEIIGLPSGYDEAREVADRIGKEVMSGKRMFKDFAVLYRTNSQSRLFEDIFRGRRYPAQVVGTVGFYSRKEVKDALAYIKLCVNPRDDLSLRRIIAEPPRGIGSTTLEKLIKYGNDNNLSIVQALNESDKIEGIAARSVKSCKTFSDQLNKWIEELKEKPAYEKWAGDILESSGYLPRLRNNDSFEAQGRLDNLDALIDSLAEFSEKEGTLTEYIEQAALATDQDKYDPNADTVKLMTIHAAKGLEFPTVFVTGIEERGFPLESQDRFTDFDEERRLFYVAVTRAREELVLTFAKKRKVWGIDQSRSPSKFLKEIPSESVLWLSAAPILGVPTPGTRMKNESQKTFYLKIKVITCPYQRIVS